MSQDALSLTATPVSSRPVTSWQRQLGDTPTRAQTVFDECVGIIERRLMILMD